MKIKLRIILMIIVLIIVSSLAFLYETSADAKSNEKTINNIEQKYKTKEVNKTIEIKDDNINKELTLEEEKLSQLKLLREKRIEEEKNNNVIKTTLENTINTDIGNNMDKIGLAYYDIKTGTYIGINDDKYFVAGSTVKVPIGMVYADMTNNGEINPSDTILYDDSMYEGGAGILQGTSMLDNPIPISELIGDMIKYSDNIATNMLINNLGYYTMKDKFSEILGHAVPKSSNTMTAKEAYTYLLKLYENRENNTYYDELKTLMKYTTTHDRIDKYVPQDIVAHKIGDYGSYVNDIGVIYEECNPYILCIYTKDISNSNELIAKISKDIYDIQKTR